MDGITGIQSRSPTDETVSSGPNSPWSASISSRLSTASSGSAYFSRSSSVRRCIHSSPPLRRTTSPARPKWSMWAWVTTSRATPSTLLPQARSASSSSLHASSPVPVAMPQSTSVSPAGSFRR